MKIPAYAFQTALFILLPALLMRYFSLKARSGRLLGDAYERGSDSKPFKRAFLYVLALFALSRLLVFLMATYGAVMTDDISKLSPLNWIRWDANHYIGLAENWYVNEGDPRFHIVFFPLYPAVLRMARVLFGWDAGVFGIVFSNACLLASSVALYCLAYEEYGYSRALLSACLFLFSPMTFFYSLPFSESLFFLLTVLSAYMAVKKKFAWAIVFGALSAYTRILGLLSAVVVFYEMIKDQKGLSASGYIKRIMAVSLIGTGFLAYLYLNYSVTGNAFTFLQYQKEHWSQSMGSVGNTLNYTLENALHYDDIYLRLGTWIPQGIGIMGVTALLCASFRLISASEAAYALLYIWFALSPTWLLSGARYISAMYPMYFCLSALLNGKKRGFTAVIFSAAALVMMFGLYLSGKVM